LGVSGHPRHPLWLRHWDEVNQDYSEQNEVDGMKKGADSTGKVMHVKERDL